MAKELIFNKMNIFFQQKIPFLFIITYDKKEGEVIPLSALEGKNIFFKTPQHQYLPDVDKMKSLEKWQFRSISKEEYHKQFNEVMKEIQNGNTYLLNLTAESEVFTSDSLQDMFATGEAKYKLYYKDTFIHFSPEPFVIIEQDKISSYPMKGTIDADLEDAENKILQDEKELNEQYTIVDLIRNDLSIVAENVKVNDFRYIEKLSTNNKNLLTISSKISGKLRNVYRNNLGDIFNTVLPAGSVTGAPKQKTTEIINRTETHVRKFYTGVWGIFDGDRTDSCVIIRYLEKRNGKYFYKSGGGITANSNFEKEYQELKDKIYAPIY